MAQAYGLLFAGQGSQHPGMCGDLIQNFSVFRESLEEASDYSRLHIRKLCQDGSSEELARTTITQPVLLTTAVALWRVVQSECDVSIHASGGHSLGEISALCCAQAVSFKDAIAMVLSRSEAMETATPPGFGGMVALLGGTVEQAEQLCTEIQSAHSTDAIVVANYNSPSQLVLSGTKEGCEDAKSKAKSFGFRRAIALPVGAPFHSPLLKPATEAFGLFCESIDFSKPVSPVFANTSAAPYPETPAEFGAILAEQVSAPVRFIEQVIAMDTYLTDREDGHESSVQWLELSVKKTLSPLVSQILDDSNTACISNTDSLRSFLKEIQS